ncbi:MAG: protein kinase [Polyangiaceae bacterium]|nr:protein kinase [Polyangiaceae bacterium]
MLHRGQIFAGRYRIIERIARGGTGIVYEAEHVATEERVALKVLLAHVLDSPDTLENFQLEARVAARLGSEHIVRILDAGYDESLGLPYLAMELLRGQTLETLVVARGALAPPEALWVMRQVAEALDRAHGYVDRKGQPAPIVHRDLKPENLFLARRSGGVIVKVLDFGVAKMLSQSQKLSRELRGTPLFMASEQIEGGRVTPQLDVWAFGLIAFYVLTRRHYWLAANDPEAGMTPLFNEVLRKAFATPTDRARALGVEPPWQPAFDAWFFRCVHRTPSARFASAGAAVEALAEALDSPLSRSLAGSWLPPASATSLLPAPPGLGDALYVEEPADEDRRDGLAPASASSAAPPRGSGASPLVDSNGAGSDGRHGVVQSMRPAAESAEPWRQRAIAVGLIALGALGVIVASFGLASKPAVAPTLVDHALTVPAANAPSEAGAAPLAGPKTLGEEASGGARKGAPDDASLTTTPPASSSRAALSVAPASSGRRSFAAGPAGALPASVAPASVREAESASAPPASASSRGGPATPASARGGAASVGVAPAADDASSKAAVDAGPRAVEGDVQGLVRPKPRASNQPDPYEGR